jgi:hypothetical protein
MALAALLAAAAPGCGSGETPSGAAPPQQDASSGPQDSAAEAGPPDGGAQDSLADEAQPPYDAALDAAADAPPEAPAGPYEIVVFDRTRITSNSAGPNFQRADAAFELKHAPFAKVMLVADLESTCFPFESWKQNPPPAGQSWPADCDAFDRNYEITLDEPAQPGAPPAIELVRAITPFGGPLHFETDVTDLANALAGQHTLRAAISTWPDPAGKVTGSNGGWNVSVRLAVAPGPAPRKLLAVVPLLNLVHGVTTKAAPVAFQTPPGATSGRIEYRATGHGGGAATIADDCLGPAEEFCLRTHTLSVDGAKVASEELWRTDCDKLCTLAHYGTPGFDYCKENPCGAIESVKASRANWCPGSVTPPLAIEGGALGKPGPHTFLYDISRVMDGGSWRLSAVYYAYSD